MDNRRVAKVYRSSSQRVKKTPLPIQPGGLFSRVKRYISSSGIPSRIASLTGSSPEKAHAGEKKGSGDNTPNASSVLPDSPHLEQGNRDPNRILSSFFQEKGNTPLSQVEYEGVMSLLDRSKASITLPLPESTPQKGAPPASGEAVLGDLAQNGTKAQLQTPVGNSTFAQYEQKKLRNVSGYDMSHANNSSLSVADYRPVYHTFHEGSRSNISMKRVYPFSGVPSPYATRIQAPNLAARKARRIASFTPQASQAEADVSVSTEQTPFKPKSKAATSLLSILDGTDPAQGAPAASSVAQPKPLHNPYAKPKRFTPMQKDGLIDKATSPCKPDEIQKTIAFDKSQPLSEEKPEEKPVASNGKPKAILEEKPAESEKVESDLFAFSSKADHNSLFGNSKASEAKPAPFSFGNAPSVSDAKKDTVNPIGSAPPTESKPAPPFSFGTKETEKPQFSFGAKTTASEPTKLFGSKPVLNFGAKDTAAKTNGTATKVDEIISIDSDDEEEKVEAKPSINFGIKPVEKSTAPLFSFGTKPADTDSAPSKPAFTFASKPVDQPGSKLEAKSPESKSAADGKPVLNFGSKPAPSFSFGQASTDAEKPAEKPQFSFGAKPAAEKTSSHTPAFSFGAKPATEEKAPEKPAFSFGAKPVAESPATDKPSFSFGAKPVSDKPVSDKPAFSFGAKSAEEKAPEKPAFNFGAKPTEEKAPASPSFSFGAKPVVEPTPSSKPEFSFGAKPTAESSDKPAFSFGTKPAVEKATSEKPAFSFGAKPAVEKAPAKPAFSFGAQPAADKADSDKPAFGFGAKPSEEKISEKPQFSFGAKPGSETEKPKFSFGAKPKDDTASTKPAFSFGSKPISDKTSETQAFGFGAQPTETKESTKTAESKPALLFGAKTNDAETPSTSLGGTGLGSKPAFSFGSKPMEQAKQSDAKPAEKPAFGFGAASQEKPSFSFGGKATEEKKPAFNFASKSNTNANDKAPSSVSAVNASDKTPKFGFGSSAPGNGLFSFGANAESKSPVGPGASVSDQSKANNASNGVSEKPSFNFGSGSGSADNGSSFSFGAKSAEAKPAFSFGGNSNGSTHAFAFGAKPSNGAGGANGEEKLEEEFDFPEAPVEHVELNQQKVKEYEDLFQF